MTRMWISCVAALVCLVIVFKGSTGLGVIDPDVVLSCTEERSGVLKDGVLAIDGDPSTCASTCFQKGAWIKLRRRDKTRVKQIIVRGYMPKYTQIRVGNNSLATGWMRGYDSNPLCIMDTAAPTHSVPGGLTDYTFHCVVPRTGNIISFSSSSVDISPQLVICDLQVA